MGIRAKRTSDGSRVSFTIRLPPDCGSWLYEMSKKTDNTLTDSVVTVLNDMRTWWGLGEPVVEKLKKDAAALGLSETDYLRYLLTSRFRFVNENGAGFDKNDPDVLLSQRR